MQRLCSHSAIFILRLFIEGSLGTKALDRMLCVQAKPPPQASTDAKKLDYFHSSDLEKFDDVFGFTLSFSATFSGPSLTALPNVLNALINAALCSSCRGGSDGHVPRRSSDVGRLRSPFWMHKCASGVPN